MDRTETHFLNVDLDLFSSRDLAGLLTALGKKVIVLHSGRLKRTYEAHVELAIQKKTADATIRTFCNLVEDLPKAQRAEWNVAKIKDFSIGIDAGTHPFHSEFPIAAETLRAVSALGARIVVTVYARPPFSSSTKVRRRSSASSQ